MKNIYLIGDSIRENYQPNVISLLEGRAQVYYPRTPMQGGAPENARWSGYTLNNLVKHMWLQYLPEKIDVVHWNNGCWDMITRHDEDGPFTPLDEYERNLRLIARELRKLTPHVIFATSTPPRREGFLMPQYATPRRYVERERTYREVVLRVMAELNIPVNDLFEAVFPERERLISDDNTHLSDEGKAFCAARVVAAIEKYL